MGRPGTRQRRGLAPSEAGATTELLLWEKVRADPRKRRASRHLGARAACRSEAWPPGRGAQAGHTGRMQSSLR